VQDVAVMVSRLNSPKYGSWNASFACFNATAAIRATDSCQTYAPSVLPHNLVASWMQNQDFQRKILGWRARGVETGIVDGWWVSHMPQGIDSSIVSPTYKWSWPPAGIVPLQALTTNGASLPAMWTFTNDQYWVPYGPITIEDGLCYVLHAGSSMASGPCQIFYGTAPTIGFPVRPEVYSPGTYTVFATIKYRTYSFGRDSYETIQYDVTIVDCDARSPVAHPVAPPVAAPIAPPVGRPVASPVAAPIAPPVAAPIAPPVARPVAPPVAAPIAPPVVAPVAPPVARPVAPPVAAPIAPPVARPVASPVAAPIAPPVSPPTDPRTVSPLTAPTASAPVLAPQAAPSKPPQQSATPAQAPNTSPAVARSVPQVPLTPKSSLEDNNVSEASLTASNSVTVALISAFLLYLL
jgi:hypothetical protein